MANNPNLNSSGAFGDLTTGLFGGPQINGAAPTIDQSSVGSALTQAQQGRGLQGQAAGLAGQLARGQGPSAVSQAYNQQVNNSTAAANALASSAPGSQQGMARRQAMMASAQGQQAAGGAAALGHAQEQLGGMGMMGSIADQQRGQDLSQANLLGGLASNQANLQEQQNQANLQAAEFQSKQNSSSVMGMAGMAAGALAFADAPMNTTTSGGSDPQGSEMHLKEPNGPSHFILREEPDFILIVNARTGKMGKLPMMPLSPEEQEQAMAPHGAGPIGQSVQALKYGDAQLSNLNNDPNQGGGSDPATAFKQGFSVFSGMGGGGADAGAAMAAADYRFGTRPPRGVSPRVRAPHAVSLPQSVRTKHSALYYADADLGGSSGDGGGSGGGDVGGPSAPASSSSSSSSSNDDFNNFLARDNANMKDSGGNDYAVPGYNPPTQWTPSDQGPVDYSQYTGPRADPSKMFTGNVDDTLQQMNNGIQEAQWARGQVRDRLRIDPGVSDDLLTYNPEDHPQTAPDPSKWRDPTPTNLSESDLDPRAGFGKYSTPGRGVGGGDASDPDAATGADPYAANPGENNPATNPGSEDPSFGKVLAGALRGYADPRGLYRQPQATQPGPSGLGVTSPGVAAPMVMHDGTTSGADPSVDRGTQMIQQLDQQRLGSLMGSYNPLKGYDPANIAKTVDTKRAPIVQKEMFVQNYNGLSRDTDKRAMLSAEGIHDYDNPQGRGDANLSATPQPPLGFGLETEYDPQTTDKTPEDAWKTKYNPLRSADELLLERARERRESTGAPPPQSPYADLPQGLDIPLGYGAGLSDAPDNTVITQDQDKNDVDFPRYVRQPNGTIADLRRMLSPVQPKQVAAGTPVAAKKAATKPLTQKFANRPKSKGRKAVLQDLSARGKSA